MQQSERTRLLLGAQNSPRCIYEKNADGRSLGSAETLDPRILEGAFKAKKVGPQPRDLKNKMIWVKALAFLSLRIPGVTSIDNQSFKNLYRALSFMKKGGKNKNMHSYLLVFLERNSKRM